MLLFHEISRLHGSRDNTELPNGNTQFPPWHIHAQWYIHAQTIQTLMKTSMTNLQANVNAKSDARNVCMSLSQRPRPNTSQNQSPGGRRQRGERAARMTSQ
jgi:hypothetical protein